ncbi:MAG: TonB-dependent receptor [Rhodocyclales bacterium]|nr:TonB-dependent receptor [Rhodocyclales bacterium]
MNRTLVAVAVALALSCEVQAAAPALSDVTVTGTREKAALAETPASVGVVKAQDIKLTGPAHPQQILGQVPGVAVAVTNGEGHTTAIRQPFTTSPLYLYLEDGIPIRATGFFNHNALYEVNIPSAGGIEVVRGPGTALYGSDAIGGIVNILSAVPADRRGAALSGEAGSHGWWRLLGSADSGWGDAGGVRGDVNLSHTDGWRQTTAYDRQSANLRWDYAPGADAALKTILGITHIDQQTGANSALIYNDYVNNPTKNNFAIAYRKVDAFRLSANLDKDLGPASQLSLTPYVRNNRMDLNGSYNLSSDPRIEKTDVRSYGLMAKWRRDFPEVMRARLILGVDIDYSPGRRAEDGLTLTSTGAGADRNYTGYTVGARIYDYEVTYKSASPYVHGEISPTARLRITAGLRSDSLHYDLNNRLAAGNLAVGARNYYQSANTAASYSHLSPKLGATFALAPAHHLYVSFNHGFRAPSESQLFRAGSDTSAARAQAKALDALALKPIKADQQELGLRGHVDGWNYDVVGYLLTKRDDILSQRDLATNATVTVNGGRTGHRGLELGLGKSFAERWRFDAAASYAKHSYKNWVTSTADLSGKEMEAAPRLIANTRLTWRPSDGAMVQIEWVKIGSYWLEASNSPTYGKYPGHDLLNLRASYAPQKNLSVFGRIMNLADKRYADSASVSSNTAVYAPGLPRSYYVGIEAKW